MVKAVLTKAPSPHFYSRQSSSAIFWKMALALVPALGALIVAEGPAVLKNLAAVFLGVFFSELISTLWIRQTVLKNGAGVLGAFLATLFLPASAPFSAVMASTFAGFFLARVCFGGPGSEIFNPAVVSLFIFKVLAPGFFKPFPVFYSAGWSDLSVVFLFAALAGGGIFLIFQKMIRPEIPVLYLTTYFAVIFIWPKEPAFFFSEAFLAAFFLIPDYATSPLKRKSQIVYAAAAGALSGAATCFSGSPVAPLAVILLMNAVAPVFDRLEILSHKEGAL